MHAGNRGRLRGRQMHFDVSQDGVSLGVGLQHSTLKRLHHGKQCHCLLRSEGVFCPFQSQRP